jgi:hypothetical protein
VCNRSVLRLFQSELTCKTNPARVLLDSELKGAKGSTDIMSIIAVEGDRIALPVLDGLFIPWMKGPPSKQRPTKQRDLMFANRSY